MVASPKARKVQWLPTLAGRNAAGAVDEFRARICRDNTVPDRARGPASAEAAGRPAAGAGAEPLRLGSKDTTVSPRNRAISQAVQPWRLHKARQWDAVSVARRQAMAKLTADPVKIRAAGDWHKQRAEGLRRPMAERLTDCCGRVIDLAHKRTGEILTMPVGCQQPLCAKCRKRRATKAARRLKAELAAVNAAQAQFKRKANLWTLTLRDSGNPGNDALVMREAWKQFRALWHDKYGWAFKFMRYEELTAGRQGQGHNHWHVLVWSPPAGKLTLARWQRWWRAALRQAAETVGTSCDMGNLDVSDRRGSAESAAAYVSKIYTYICKESFELEDLESEKAASYLAAVYGRRRFTTSRYLLKPADGKTSEYYVVALRDWAPGDPGGQAEASAEASAPLPAEPPWPPGGGLFKLNGL